MTMPRKLYKRFGVDYYEIDEQQFLNPGLLIDMLVNNKTSGSASSVCKTGVFVARLSVPTLSEAYVEQVKNLATKDVDFEEFKPLMVKRMPRWREAGFYAVTTETEGTTTAEKRTLRNLRKQFRREFLNVDFGNPQKSNLEQVLDTSGVGPCIDAFYARLQRLNSPILYAANMDLTTLGEDLGVSVDLKISSGASMSEMDSLIKFLGTENSDYPGINRPTVYVGSEASLFQCHREDVALQAINMHVAGAPKIWFVVPPKYFTAFTKVLEKLGLKTEERLCASVLQHKFFFLDPRILLAEKIPVHTIIQRPGDIVFLLPNAVQFGFNLGWNVSEAVNCCSKTYCFPGMLALQLCHCPVVSGIQHDFDITRILRKAEIPEDMIALYLRNKLVSISSQFRLLHPELHPEMGIPGDSPLRNDHLLGENVEEDEVGKLWVDLTMASEEDDDRWLGGFDEIQLDEEDDEVVDRPKGTRRRPTCQHDTKKSAPKNGRGAVESHVRQKHTAQLVNLKRASEEDDDRWLGGLDEIQLDEEDDEVVDRPKGTHRCPACQHDTKRGGPKAGREAVESHVRQKHTAQFANIMAKYERLYTKRPRLDSAFECDVCKKQYSTQSSLNRHVRSTAACQA
ncbi:putative lysine-specific demethylase 4A [Frankliniella fusca]|uniref:Lysine-specific demethylase 4A n=1 Tax=Frankliniella fusca TaxID=407009 RepID=A0AAE1LHS3_9NEOP|nr:putative lysine-specific demethylase 4A [Frankliniella fusca]